MLTYKIRHMLPMGKAYSLVTKLMLPPPPKKKTLIP